MGRPKLNRKKQYITLSDEAYTVLHRVSEETKQPLGYLLDQCILEVYGPENTIQEKMAAALDVFKEGLRDEMIGFITHRERSEAVACGIDQETIDRIFPIDGE